MPQSSRRDFFKKVGLVLGSAGLFGLSNSCDPSGSEDSLNSGGFFDKDKQSSGNSEGNSGSSGSSSGTSSKDYWDSLELNVDNPPYKKLDFSYGKDVSDYTGFCSPEGYFRTKIRNFYMTESPSINKPIEAIDAFLLEDKYEAGELFAFDPKLRYFPRTFHPSYLKSAKDYEDIFVKFDKLSDYDFKLKEFLLKEIDDKLGTWDWEKIDDKPGLIYLGDWSYEEISNLSSFLAKLGVIISSVIGSGGAATPLVVSAVSKSDQIISGIGNVIDGYNKIVPQKYEWDKSREYSYYAPVSGLEPNLFTSFLIGEPVGYLLENKEENFKDFFPTEPGNEWVFRERSSGQEVKINFEGMKKFKGKDVIYSKNQLSGLEEYFAFSNGVYKQVGFYYPELGEVLFDPLLTFGPEKIKPGVEIKNENVRAVFKNYPSLEAKFSLDGEYQKREVIKTDVCTFGSAIKLNTKTSFEANFEGETAKSFSENNLWFAKNVGKVREELVSYGDVFDLIGTNLTYEKSWSFNKSARINNKGDASPFGVGEKLSHLALKVLNKI